MKLGDEMVTPVYLKSSTEMPWPNEEVFYLMTADGLFLCRNHVFFRSAVPAPRPPTELAWQTPLLQVRYPKITQRQVQQIVAFFAYVGELHNAEAIVLLGWNRRSRKVEIIVPQQVASVGRSRWGRTWPIGVDYERPTKLCQDVTIFGDVHSHVDGAAYASGIDRHDETHRPGLHVVIGRISQEPPDFFVQAVVDGTRFNIQRNRVMEGYQCRSRRFPGRWLERVRIQWSGEKPFPVRLQMRQDSTGGGNDGCQSTDSDQEESEHHINASARSSSDVEPSQSTVSNVQSDQQRFSNPELSDGNETETTA